MQCTQLSLSPSLHPVSFSYLQLYHHPSLVLNSQWDLEKKKRHIGLSHFSLSLFPTYYMFSSPVSLSLSTTHPLTHSITFPYRCSPCEYQHYQYNGFPPCPFRDTSFDATLSRCVHSNALRPPYRNPINLLIPLPQPRLLITILIIINCIYI